MYTQDTTRGPSAGGSGQDNVYRFDGVDVTTPRYVSYTESTSLIARSSESRCDTSESSNSNRILAMRSLPTAVLDDSTLT